MDSRGAAGERREREARGGRDGVYAAATLIQDSSSHHLLPFKSAKNTSRWTSQKTLIYRARPFVHMGWKLPSTRRSHVVISFTCPNQRKCVNILSEKKGSRYFTNYSKHKKMTAYFLCRMVFGVN